MKLRKDFLFQHLRAYNYSSEPGTHNIADEKVEAEARIRAELLVPMV